MTMTKKSDTHTVLESKTLPILTTDLLSAKNLNIAQIRHQSIVWHQKSNKNIFQAPPYHYNHPTNPAKVQCIRQNPSVQHCLCVQQIFSRILIFQIIKQPSFLLAFIRFRYWQAQPSYAHESLCKPAASDKHHFQMCLGTSGFESCLEFML